MAAFIILSILTVSLSPIFANKVEAQWIVWDPGNFVPNTITAVNTTVAGPVKEFGLDTIAWIIVNLVIERMAASTVNWINTGFKGSPAFVTDPEKYFADIGKKVAGQYIFTNKNLGFLCGPIQAKVRIALAKNFIYDNRQWQCTLDDVKGNLDDFLDDFEKGSWDKFFELSQREQNNPIGALMKAENELSLQISTRQDVKEKELNWGNGFLSWKDCALYDKGAKGQTVTDMIDQSAYNDSGEYVENFVTGPERTLPDVPPKCIQERINTPGSVISTQLNKTLGIGSEKLAVADEINEMVSALLNQLVGKIVGGIGSGLRSLSRPDSTQGNQIFTEQLKDREPGDTITDYFGEAPDTSAVDDISLQQVKADLAGAQPDPNRVVNPSDSLGGGGSSVIPIDNDCQGLSISSLGAMAEEDVAAGKYSTLDDAMRNLDCSPEGIN